MNKNANRSKTKEDIWSGKNILVTGGRGFVGSHVLHILKETRGVNSSQILIPSSKADDLRVFANAERLVKQADIVLHLASDVGGISYSSTHQATQLRNCLLMDLNIFEAVSLSQTEKFVCISSAVAYPENASSPLKEEDLFNGFPAKGGYGYGIAKRMSAAFSRAYHDEKGVEATVLLSTNAYGPGDSFDLKDGHVIPSLIRKCLTEKTLNVWGDGTAVRDFIYVKDLANAIVSAGESSWIPEPVNIGSGDGVQIKDLVEKIVMLTGFSGDVVFDASKPSGQKTRILDTKRAHSVLQFSPHYSLEKGLAETIAWYKEQQ